MLYSSPPLCCFLLLQVKVDNQASLQDITSVVAIADCYSTMEPYIDSKYDLYIQKIGNNYRTFVYVCSNILLAYLLSIALNTLHIFNQCKVMDPGITLTYNLRPVHKLIATRIHKGVYGYVQCYTPHKMWYLAGHWEELEMFKYCSDTSKSECITLHRPFKVVSVTDKFAYRRNNCNCN